MSDQDDFDGPAITRGRPQQHTPEPYKKMKSAMDYYAGILFWMALGGAVVWGYGVATEKKASTTPSVSVAQRKQANLNAVSAGPQSTAWETPYGTVIALDIPKASAGGLLVEQKRCIVWRDAVTNTSSLQCDKDEIDIKNYPTDRPDIE